MYDILYDINALDRILDQIVKETLEAMERRKTQVYNIAENSRGEMSKIHGELDGIKEPTPCNWYRPCPLKAERKKLKSVLSFYPFFA